MSLNDDAVVTAAQGFVYTATVGTAAPTPAEVDALDPITFGGLKTTVVVTGAPTSYTLGVGSDFTTALPLASTAAQVQAALELLPGIGSGNVHVTGTSAVTPGLAVTFIGAKLGLSVVLVEGTYVAGTSPDTTFTTTTALNGWKQVGHTSRDDMPEFGFDGGDFELKGTWQNENLREVLTKAIADFVVLVLEQFDRGALELYYGADAASTSGVFGVAGGTPVPVEKAFLVIIRDGDVKIGFYAIKASIRRDDSIKLPVDGFAGLPVRATFLKHGANRLYDWISEDLIS